MAGLPAVLRTQHHGIYDAAQALDGELAARVLREHIEWLHEKAREATATPAAE